MKQNLSVKYKARELRCTYIRIKIQREITTEPEIQAPKVLKS